MWNWSYSIGRVAGINIKIHVTFVLILLFGAMQWGGLTSPGAALFGVLLTILLFVCVTLHELGHSFVARAFGIKVNDIVLSPLGGVAFLTRLPDKPLHELLIAAAGPLVNIVIAAVLLVVGLLVGVGSDSIAGMAAALRQPSLGTLWLWLIVANVSLVLFNIIPAFPLDGGRIFRSLLALVVGNVPATRVAAMVGQFVAVLLGVYGVFNGNILLLAVALFIFFAAAQENAYVREQARQARRSVALVPARLDAGLSLEDARRIVAASGQPVGAVYAGERFLGYVRLDDLNRMLDARTSARVYPTSSLSA
ncbi:MAG: site-2 protease family protein [Anaerolineae bacterium]